MEWVDINESQPDEGVIVFVKSSNRNLNGYYYYSGNKEFVGYSDDTEITYEDLDDEVYWLKE